MTQERLNDVALCNVHQEYLDHLDLPSTVNQFNASNEHCMQLFGKFCPNLLSAVDRAFKLHYIFNVAYIHAAEHVWQLLKKHAHQIQDTVSALPV